MSSSAAVNSSLATAYIMFSANDSTIPGTSRCPGTGLGIRRGAGLRGSPVFGSSSTPRILGVPEILLRGQRSGWTVDSFFRITGGGRHRVSRHRNHGRRRCCARRRHDCGYTSRHRRRSCDHRSPSVTFAAKKRDAVLRLGSAAPGLNNAAPGPNSAAPGPNNAAPGPNNAARGLHNAAPGPNNAGPELDSAVPGPNSAGPELDSALPGLHNAGPELDNAAPGLHNAGWGLNNAVQEPVRVAHRGSVDTVRRWDAPCSTVSRRERPA